MQEDNEKKKEQMKQAIKVLPKILLVIVAAVLGYFIFNLLTQPKPAPVPQQQSGSTSQKVKVIEYEGKYLPVDQLEVVTHMGCDDASHYHIKDGETVTATDGSQLADPGPPCGFGKVSDRPTTEIGR